jgi:hypothetical protein
MAVKFLNQHHCYRKWSVNDDVFCDKCDSVFKVIDMVVNDAGNAGCPVCLFDLPDQFHTIPHWRRDLMDEFVHGTIVIHKWRVKPILATVGKPVRLSHRDRFDRTD